MQWGVLGHSVSKLCWSCRVYWILLVLVSFSCYVAAWSRLPAWRSCSIRSFRSCWRYFAAWCGEQLFLKSAKQTVTIHKDLGTTSLELPSKLVKTLPAAVHRVEVNPLHAHAVSARSQPSRDKATQRNQNAESTRQMQVINPNTL